MSRFTGVCPDSLEYVHILCMGTYVRGGWRGGGERHRGTVVVQGVTIQGLMS